MDPLTLMLAAAADLAECRHPTEVCEGDGELRTFWCSHCGSRSADGGKTWRYARFPGAVVAVARTVEEAGRG